jgi:glucose/arabinose dehydrogenase
MRTALALLILLVFAAPAAAAPSLAKLGDFEQPTYAASPPGDPSRVFVTEKTGRVRLLVDGTLATAPFLDLSAITQTDYEERGLLSIAFPPDYQQSGLFYAYLTANAPAGEIQIREFRRADADHAAPGPGRLVLAITHQLSNHNGGQLQFGPDGMLWIGVGDGGGANDTEGNAQVLTSLKGKLLRIDPRAAAGRAYTVPADNPFGNEVWAYGLRNPWRFAFDRATGDLAIGDVGQGAHEEVDFATRAGGLGRGANYGWPCWEGQFDNPAVSCAKPAGAVDPVIDQSHDDGWCAIVGGPVVRDPGLPTLNGRYLYGDFCQSALHRADLAAGQGSDGLAGVSVAQLSAIGEDACGRVYTASLAGPVSQVVDGTPSPCGPPPGPPAAGPPPGPAPDTTPCGLAVRSYGRRAVVRRRHLRVRVRATERCRVTVTGRIRGVARFRTAHRTLPANRGVTVRLRLSGHGVRALRHALRRHRTVTVRLRVRGLDAAGNARTVNRRVGLRR